MKAAKMSYFRELLVMQMITLQNAVGKTRSGMKTDTGKCADSFDMAVVELNWQMGLSMRGRERRIIQEIREALQRIDRGFLGYATVVERPSRKRGSWQGRRAVSALTANNGRKTPKDPWNHGVPRRVYLSILPAPVVEWMEPLPLTMHLNTLFVISLGLALCALFLWGFRGLPKESWQILACIPWHKNKGEV